MTTTITPRLHRAYRAGRQAWESGGNQARCPQINAVLRGYWLQGWEDASREKASRYQVEKESDEIQHSNPAKQR